MSEPTTTWHVTSQQTRTQVNSQGNVSEGYEVAFQTGQGHVGTVFVPMNQYTVAKVRELVAAQAQLLDQVGALTHDS